MGAEWKISPFFVSTMPAVEMQIPSSVPCLRYSVTISTAFARIEGPPLYASVGVSLRQTKVPSSFRMPYLIAVPPISILTYLFKPVSLHYSIFPLFTQSDVIIHSDFPAENQPAADSPQADQICTLKIAFLMVSDFSAATAVRCPSLG